MLDLDLKNKHLPPARKQHVLTSALIDICSETWHLTLCLLEFLTLAAISLFVAAVLFVALL